jgi:hypothetical protein
MIPFPKIPFLLKIFSERFLLKDSILKDSGLAKKLILKDSILNGSIDPSDLFIARTILLFKISVIKRLAIIN